MNTRRAKDDSVFYQSKFASSPEFDHGLTSYQVSKRCACLSSRPDRELVWFLQYLSTLPGGLAAVATRLVNQFPHRLGPRAMVATGKRAGDSYTPAEVREIRKELPRHMVKSFLLRDEHPWEALDAIRNKRLDNETERLNQWDEIYLHEMSRRAMRSIDCSASELAVMEAEENRKAAMLPETYSVDQLMEVCKECAANGGECGDASLNLERWLARLCLDPACDFVGPWYFSDLVAVLREYQQQWAAEKAAAGVVTEVGLKINQTLDYTLEAGQLTLLTGKLNLGADSDAVGHLF